MGRPVAGTPHLRTSERKDFKRCVARWDWRWRKGLVPKYPRPDARWFGTGIHLALQHRYSLPGTERGYNVLGVWRDYCNDEAAGVWVTDEEDDQHPKWVDARELGEIMLGGYLDEYGLDPTWHVLSAEQRFEFPVPYPKREGTMVLYNGTFDFVGRDLETDGSLWLWDHKTAKQITLDHLPLDDQAGSYWAVASKVLSDQGIIPRGEKLDGILYNFLRKGKPDPRPRNAAGQYTNQPTKEHFLKSLTEAGCIVHGKMTKDRLIEEAEKWGVTVLGEVSERQPPALFHREPVYRTAPEQRTQIRKIQAEHLHMDAVRRRLLPIIKTPTPDCRWDCDYFQMCELQESGDDWQAFRDGSFKKSDPYADHRESADAD
jgi:hypothetical protein